MPSTPRLAALVLAGALVLTGCTAGPAANEPGDTGNPSAPTTETKTTDNTDAVGADGIVIPGQVVALQLGEPVTYYSMPKLTKDDIQTVTIHSFEYIERAELEESAPLDKIETGVLVLTLSWEGVAGRTQSNQGYVKATLDNGETGIPFAFRDDRLRNGGVELGETREGTFTIAINRGVTTLTIEDYTGEPVARVLIDTSK